MGLTVKKKCRERCDLNKHRIKCTHPKVIDSYYVEFHVHDDGKMLTLANGGGGQIKRWKVGSLNKTIARQQEVLIKTDLMKGLVKSDQANPVTFKAWGETYLNLEGVRRLRSFKDRRDTVTLQLIPFFGKKALTEISAEDVEAYRAQRRKRNGKPASLGTVNNDHIMLKHCLNIALRKGLILVNPATLVPIPNAHNERDRVLTPEEWERLYAVAVPHLKPILLTAYHLGQRLGEIFNLTWDRVDLQRGIIMLRGMDTKTKKPRQIPITPPVKAALVELS